MLGFLDWFVDIIQMLWSFLMNLINSILILVDVLNNAVTLPFVLFGLMPGIIGASITAVAAIGIAKLLIGWGNQ